MRLQVLAILENGASKLLPAGSDTLRILLILRDQDITSKVGGQGGDRGPPTGPVRRRVMASLAGGSA